MRWSTQWRKSWTIVIVAASCGAADRPGVANTALWREWFASRAFGEDPYFFLPAGASGASGCPENRRLSFAGSDSSAVQLSSIDERGSAPEIRAMCTVRFHELTGRPAVGTMPDGRSMWVLHAANTDSNDTR